MNSKKTIAKTCGITRRIRVYVYDIYIYVFADDTLLPRSRASAPHSEPVSERVRKSGEKCEYYYWLCSSSSVKKTTHAEYSLLKDYNKQKKVYKRNRVRTKLIVYVIVVVVVIHALSY